MDVDKKIINLIIKYIILMYEINVYNCILAIYDYDFINNLS